MHRALRPLVLAVAAATVMVACARVPYSGRRQFNMIPNGIMHSLGKSTYQSMLSERRVDKTSSDAQVLRRVGQRMTRASGETKYSWTYKLLAEDTINAWCVPGGYIAFYTGILPALETEASMAFVMGHEIGHVVAHHGAERMSQKLAVLGGMAGLSAYVGGKSQLTDTQKAVILGALGVGAQYGILLPFSRKHEHEADVIGMMTMAKAGYPPAESIETWDRLERIGGSHAAFLSTHPSYKSRKETQREWMGKARKRYQRNALGYDTTESLWMSSGSRSSSSSSSSSGSKSRKKKKSGGKRQHPQHP